jgi:hypothetical protein
MDLIIALQHMLRYFFAVHVGPIGASQVFYVMLSVFKRYPGVVSGDRFGRKPNPALAVPADSNSPSWQLDNLVLFTIDDLQIGACSR